MALSNKSKRYPVPVDVAATEITAATPTIQEKPQASVFKTLMVLFKARVVSLLLIAALGGAFIGAGSWPGWNVLALTLFSGWLAASGASALNQYIERKSDGTMVRTRHRPLVDGYDSEPEMGALGRHQHDCGGRVVDVDLQPLAGNLAGRGRIHLRRGVHNLA